MQESLFVPIIGARVHDSNGRPMVATLRYGPRRVAQPQILTEENKAEICKGFRDHMVTTRQYCDFTADEAKAFVLAYYGVPPEEILVECQ